MSYESADELGVLKAFWRPGADLENTLFTFLDPYGRQLTRGARSPDFMFRDAHDMASTMEDLARDYRGRDEQKTLPVVNTVRLGLNVAACDKRPLAIVVGDTERDRKIMENNLAPLAWSKEFVGKLIYTDGSKRELNSVYGASLSKGYLFLTPNEFGTEATVVAQLGPNASSLELSSAMKQTINSYRPWQLDHREHIRLGRQQGLQWKTATPVTDRGELRARQMGGPGMGGPGMRGPGMRGPGMGGPGMGGPGMGARPDQFDQ